MYLVDIPGKESDAIKRLLKLLPITGGLFKSLGLDSLFSWYLIEVRTDLHLGLLPTDIDILAGRLSWSDPGAFRSILAEEIKNEPNAPQSVHRTLTALKLAESGGIKWPPLTDSLIGIEAKCAYLDLNANEIKEDTIKSKKSSKEKVYGIQKQVEKLLSFGFDKAALLDMIANPPASGIDGQAWITALSIATSSKDAMSLILRQRLPNNSTAGHWVWSIGSIIGGDETRRGAGAPIELQKASENKFLYVNTDVKTNREKMEIALNNIFGNISPPYNFPAIFVDCRTCRTIHRLGDTCNSG